MSLVEIYYGVLEALQMPVSYFVDTDKRIHFLYIFTSLGLAFYVYKKAQVKGSFLAYVFDKESWVSKSAFVDYGLLFCNAFVKVFLIGPYLVFGIYLSYKVEGFLPDLFGYPKASLSASSTLILYTICLTLLSDFATYLVHYLMHRIPFLWEFHKVHHSATSLNPITQYRLHPVELIVNNAKGILVLGVVTGLFSYLSANPVELVTVIGANIFSFAFLVFGANLRHSRIPLKYFGWLEYIFISPYQHQIHHSKKTAHFNKNMGSKLAVWDWIFGTLIRSESVESLTFGIGKEEEPIYDSLWKNLVMPFKNLLSTFK
jgi:sterol desaturase/sphingolipid hydroxylase (fatty acid hydroxylase superfamily)